MNKNAVLKVVNPALAILMGNQPFSALLSVLTGWDFFESLHVGGEAKSFLISEALSGEGGILRNRAGEAFMTRYDPRRELAPRDVVARSIDAEVKRRGDDCAFLDMTHLPKAFLIEHFPHIYATCKEFGIDMAVQPIPVVPAAHYQCGGVVTDLTGRTTVPRLLAVGEVACTGLHGANRLASNSLLEGLVFGTRAARAARAIDAGGETAAPLPDWNPGDALDPDEGVVVTHNWDEVRRTMWNYVGIVRSVKRLERARTRLAMLRSEIREYYWKYKVTPDLVELRNLADVAMLVVECALRRRESRDKQLGLAADAEDSELQRGRDQPQHEQRDPSERAGAAPAVLGHSLLAIPFVVITVSASLKGFDVTLEKAAMSLGASRIQTFFKITFPLIRPGVISGALFAFIISFDEIVISMFICGISSVTLPVKYMGRHSNGNQSGNRGGIHPSDLPFGHSIEFG